MKRITGQMVSRLMLPPLRVVKISEMQLNSSLYPLNKQKLVKIAKDKNSKKCSRN